MGTNKPDWCYLEQVKQLALSVSLISWHQVIADGKYYMLCVLHLYQMGYEAITFRTAPFYLYDAYDDYASSYASFCYFFAIDVHFVVHDLMLIIILTTEQFKWQMSYCEIAVGVLACTAVQNLVC